MATTFVFTPEMFADGRLADVGGVNGDFFGSVGTSQALISQPAFGGRSGTKSLKVNNTFGGELRAPLKGGSVDEAIIHCAYYFESLPGGDNRFATSFQDGAGNLLGRFRIDTAGFMDLLDSTGATVAVSASAAINAGEWTLFEFRCLRNASGGELEVRDVDGNVLVNATGLNTGAASIAQIAFRAGNGASSDFSYHISDLWVKDATGTKNNTFGPRKIVAQNLIGDNAGNGWIYQARSKLGDGVLYISDADGPRGLYQSDNASFEIGAGDFTYEGFYRWATLPGTSTSRTLAAKWRENDNTRSWRLKHYESTGAYNLSFEISTDGTAGTVTTIAEGAFTPVVNHWYHIAVNRTSGVTTLYVDGVRLTSAVADTNTYYDGSANLAVGAHSTNGNTNTNSFGGWLDELRFTVGASRYSSEFTPPSAKFPRDSSDTSWNNVQLLMGFDGAVGIADESQYGRTVFVPSPPYTSVSLPEDGSFGYQSIDKTFRDDTFIEAPFTPSIGTVEFTSNPSAAQTVTIGNLPSGSTTYTFVSTLVSANDVLIGADAEESLANLKAAINQEAGEGSTYGTGTVAHADALALDQAGTIIRIEARVPGTAGDSITLAATVTGVVLSGASLANGADIPAASEFNFAAVPPGVTAVSAVILVTKNFLTGSGTATAQYGVRDSASNLILGSDHTPPSNAAWHMDIFDTGAGGSTWSATALIGSRTYNNRTS